MNARDFERTLQQLSEQLNIPVEEARAQLAQMAQEVVLPDFLRPPEKRFGGEPANPADRRTFRLAGKPKHYVQVNGRLRLRDGESPWI